MLELPSKASQIGHQLVIDQVQYGDVGQYRCTGRLKGDISTDEASLNIGGFLWNFSQNYLGGFYKNKSSLQ